MTAQQRYTKADRAIKHYQLLIAGHLSPAQRRQARIQIVRAVFARALALRAIARTEEIAA